MTIERILWLSQDLDEQFDVWVKQSHTDWAVCFGAFFLIKNQIKFSPSKSRWTFRQNVQNKRFTEHLWKLKHKTKREGRTEKIKEIQIKEHVEGEVSSFGWCIVFYLGVRIFPLTVLIHWFRTAGFCRVSVQVMVH